MVTPARRRSGGRSAVRRTAVGLATTLLATCACTGPAAGEDAHRAPEARTGTPAGRAAPQKTATAAATCADTVYAGMTTAQRVGQLFMGGVAANAPSATDLRTLRTYHVGSVMLTGRSSAGTTATRKIVDNIRKQADTVGGRQVGMIVSTDQEGGQVQVLNGPGFSVIPAALTQGTWSTTTLRSRATTWAKQLKAAGLDLDLAPVADVVPAGLGTRNAPIGRYHREFGYTPAVVTSHSGAFAAGFAAAGVMTTFKHFPGLGQVIGNTDTTANVVDSVTTTSSASLTPFRSGIAAGAPFVMISSAKYTKIDSAHLAVFSPTVINKLLRTQFGFKGVVISDDIGQAVAVRAYTPAQRAVGFLSAGGDMILTVKPSTVPAMAQAVQSRMATDAAFRAKVAASVHRVLTAKANAGRLSCG
ncbi:glycoside hydrolase family 3 N-terminal domain-containing protein [Streptomyces humi]|uniref:glycoside hydrolase family 3 N-terminal domain-containing protein n=1 Tax=Streptomyces humi TaxID=1428620 RepID=UPI0006289459|nr:glycoside hydrolase family 3 N-terminal domain-containing protein [Streptomyces humi]